MTILEKRQWAVGRVQYWWERLQINYNKQLGSPPSVRFNNTKQTAGLAYSSINMIKLSDHFLSNETQQDYDQTIAHEVCHIFADRLFKCNCHHNWRWQNIMKSLGLSPDRCHSYTSAKPRTHRKSSLLMKCGCGKEVLIGAKNQRKLFAGTTLWTSCCRQKITCEKLVEMK